MNTKIIFEPSLDTHTEYRFVTTSPGSVQLDLSSWLFKPKKNILFYSDKNVLLGSILVDGTLSIYSGYAFDGCSPAWRIFGKWIGTPTPEKTYTACLVHDFLYQFLERGFWTREFADNTFLDIMRLKGFKLSSVYFGAVRVFGGIFHFLNQ